MTEEKGEKFRQYEDRITELEKENAKLQQKIQILNLNGNIVFRELTKAKEIIKYLLSFIQKENYRTRWDINLVEAEQFLKED